jgi:hypothetical protein
MGTDEGVHVWEIATGREAAGFAIGRTGSALSAERTRTADLRRRAGLQRWPIQDRAMLPSRFNSDRRSRIALPLHPDARLRSRMEVYSSPRAKGADAPSSRLPRRERSRASSVNPSAGYVAPSPDGAWLATAGWHSPFLRLSNVRTGELTHEWNSESLAGISFHARQPRAGRAASGRMQFLGSKDPVTNSPAAATTPRYGCQVAFSPDES